MVRLTNCQSSWRKFTFGKFTHILEAPSGTPSCMLYLELGCIPIRFLIMQRRLMYLHYLLQQDGDSLLFKFTNAHIEEHIKGDWIKQININIEEAGIIWSLEEIQKLSEENFQLHVKKCIKKTALEWLNSEKKSKSKGVVHADLQMQSYLRPNSLSIKQKKLLFSLRLRMINVRENFREKYRNDKTCKLCNEETETQEHVLNCKEIVKNANMMVDDKIEYIHIFDETVAKQSKVAILFENLWKIRNKCMKENDIKTS